MKILMGSCGIGNGHTFRQLPVFLHLLENYHQIMVFAYGTSLLYFKKNYGGHANVTVVEVANPFFVGNTNGLDYYATQHLASNKQNFHEMNCSAMAKAQEKLGKPDLVISDYECVSAQYAYAEGAPLVTLDQQSKFLCGRFDNIDGTNPQDEVKRLSMFFPKAKARLAISFFNLIPNDEKVEDVSIFPPIIRQELIDIKNNKQDSNVQKTRKSILVYFSEQDFKEQYTNQPIEVLKDFPESDFHVFLPSSVVAQGWSESVKIYSHGDPNFLKILSEADGVISTAGHTLLSEALFLEKPLYVMPIARLYEQQINAQVVAVNGFGLKHSCLTKNFLQQFLNNLQIYTNNIREDKNNALLKGTGKEAILQKIDEILLGKQCRNNNNFVRK
jgi:uncharacterized protein (TIGR00661 family)